MLKLTDIEDRELIVQKYKDYYFIGRFNNTNGDVYFYNYLDISNRWKNPFYTSYKTRADHNSDIRKPSLEKLHWFLECEKAGKFISKEEALKTFNKIPEYVELTEYLTSEEVFTIGKIYKIDEAGLTSDCDFTYSKDDLEWLFKKYYKFKPSTKEAYEAQFKHEEFKVGDWVTANGKDHTKNNPNFPLNQAFRIEKFTANGDKKNYYVHVDRKVSKILGHSTNVHDLRKAKLEEIPTDKLTDDELLELAKEHYPIGTVYVSTHNNQSEFTVTSMDWINSHRKAVIFGEDMKGIIHDNGKWAKIVSQPKVKSVVELMEPAQLAYISAMSQLDDVISKVSKVAKNPELIVLKSRKKTNFEPSKPKQKTKFLKPNLIKL